ncbi:MAG: pyrimidine-nucleoside phosphorylase [Clostridia bacterium]|nr:pyrimidine-nucleoside phosphorylase [Clostridia bacterium]MBR3128898.1 pyrimidine-nucleoside phosphorylase [Clostridia bacterium]
MRMVDLIEKKVNGGILSDEEIAYIVKGFTDGTIPDYQMAAFQMAVVFQGMTDRETADLTMAMMHSGDVVDLSELRGVKVDKHSTGGVGDTTTLVIAPLVAACGGTVAKMSGRGLGHTGGTLDKLESIPGVCIEQPMDRFKKIVNEIGVAVIGQTGNLVPADKKMYALRDVTATVRSIPLIASSIMSKKLAAGTDAIVLDVKTGTGAFMSTVEEAEKLAHLMVSIGKLVGRECVAIITDMNQPLGLAVGNALEVREAVELLSGKIPAGDPLYEVCMLLGTHMMILSKLAVTEVEAREKLETALSSGAGLRKLREMIAAEGGDASYIDVERINELCKVKTTLNVYPKRSGYISAMNAERIGTAAQILGAGRATKEESIDPSVGLVMKKRLGDFVRADEPLCVMYVNDESKLNAALEMFHSAFEYSGKKPDYRPMVYDVVRA